MSDDPKTESILDHGLLRRDFLKTGLAAGAGVAMASSATPLRASTSSNDTLKVGIIGTGSQGRVLIDAASNIPNLEWVAVCDIWEYANRYGQGILRKGGFKPRPYFDYREMLEKETDMDAVIVATPDFMHSPMTVDALNAGKHVYCEKLMSNDLEEARKMVKASQQTGKLLQIGHQRRSNPRYQFARDKIMQDIRMLGRVTNINGQWNRSASEDLGWPKKFEIDTAKLNEFGYKDMHQFRNWRWYKDLGGGPISDLGAHQIDVFGWFLNSDPTSVMASGGVDYYENHEWEDNVMAIYEFPTEQGTVRAFYQVLTTTSAGGGYYEYFMGDEGSLKMSENPKYTRMYRENNAPEWNQYLADGLLRNEGDAADKVYKPWHKYEAAESDTVDVRETAALAAYELNVSLDKAIHQPHLENFFDAIRKNDKSHLVCSGEEGFKSTAIVLRVNEAVAAGRRLYFKPEDLIA